MVNPLTANPTTAARRLTTGASDWLWVVTAIMGISALVTLAWGKMQPRGRRAFHHMALAVLTVSTIAYFAMASNLGQTVVRTEFRSGPTRSIFYVRYIQWFINAPLILLSVLFITGLPLSDLFLTIFMILVTIVSGLVGALTPSSYKWGFYFFGLLTLFYVFYSVIFSGLRSRLLDTHKSVYSRSAVYLVFVWMLYPVCWALSEGANVLTVNREMIFYSILDLFAGPLFLFMLLASLRDVDYDGFGLQSGKASDYVNAPRVEKPREPVVA